MNKCPHKPAYLHYLFPRRTGQRQPFLCKHCSKPIRESYSKHPALRLVPIALLLLLLFCRVFTGFPTLAAIIALCLLYSYIRYRTTTFYPLDDADDGPVRD